MRIEAQEMAKATAAGTKLNSKTFQVFKKVIGIRELYMLSRDANSAAKDASSAASSSISLLQQRLVDLQKETQSSLIPSSNLDRILILTLPAWKSGPTPKPVQPHISFSTSSSTITTTIKISKPGKLSSFG